MKARDNQQFSLNRIFLIIFSVLFVCGILQQLYYKVKYEGNLIFYIANESLVDPAQLEIFIGGIKIIDEEIENGFHWYKRYSAKTTSGNHKIAVRMNGELAEDYFYDYRVLWRYLGYSR